MSRRTNLIAVTGIVLSALALLAMRPVAGQSARTTGVRKPAGVDVSISSVDLYSEGFAVQAAPESNATTVSRIVGSLQLQHPENEAQRELSQQDRHLETETRAILGRYKATEDSNERAELEQKLSETVAKHFDVRHQQRELEMEEVKKRLERLQRQLDDRNAARDDIIQNRLEQLLRDARGLGWGTNHSGGAPSSAWFNHIPQVQSSSTNRVRTFTPKPVKPSTR